MHTGMRRLRLQFGASIEPATGAAGASIWKLALILSFILFAIYADAFSVDAADDVFFRQSRSGTYDLALANYVNGRFVPGAIFQMLSASGIEIHRIWTTLQFVAIAMVAGFSVTFVTRLALPLSQVETFAISGLIAMFPYMIILIANKNNAVNATLAYAAAGIAIYFHSKLVDWSRVVVPAFFLFICVASYQTTVYYFLVFTIGLQISQGANWRETLLPLASAAAACATAFLVYFIVYRLIVDWALLEMARSNNPELAAYYGNPRSQANDLNGFIASALMYVISVVRVLFAPEPILPLALKALALVVFLVSYWRWNDSLHPRLDAAALAFVYKKQRFLVLAILMSVGSPIHLALTNTWLAPRVLAHTGAVWAVLLAAALVLGPPKWRGRIMLCVTVLLLGIAFTTYTVVRSTARLHARDVALAHEIVAGLQRDPKFNPDLPLAIVGLLGTNSSYMTNTFSYYDLNKSKFGNEWSKRAILDAAAGRKFALPDARFDKVAKQLCADLETGHTPYGTAVTNHGTVVCLQ